MRSDMAETARRSWLTKTTVRPSSFLRSCDEVDEPLLAAAVDAGGRLVEQEQLGAGGEGAGDEDALLLAAGEFADGASA